MIEASRVVRVEDIWPEWHTDERLGAGAYGTVWRATRETSCAVKIIEVTRDANEVAALCDMGVGEESVHLMLERRATEVLAEIETMDSLRDVHNIVHIKDYRLVELPERNGYAIGIRMELLEPLVAHFRRVGQPKSEEVARLGIDLCWALEACHERGVIHRDVKPNNVFWSEAESCYKLGDFGIARRLERETAQTMSRKGTGPYMAPEVYFGRRYAADVDIYSLGIMLYRMLNAWRSPFLPAPPTPIDEHDIEVAEHRRLMGEEMPAPSGTEAGLGRIVCHACAPEPAGRYAHASELRVDLEAWLARQEVLPLAETTAGVPDADDVAEDGGAHDGLGRMLSRRAFAGGAIVAVLGLAGVWLQMRDVSADKGSQRIVDIAAGDYHTVGVRADGTCVASGSDGAGQCDVADWTDIVAVAAGASHTVGLRTDGTCVACGENGSGQCEVSDWEGVAGVTAGASHTVGLRTDGTCVACGYNGSGQCDVDSWTDIIAVAAGASQTVGVRSDGSVEATGGGYFSGLSRADMMQDIKTAATGTWGTIGIRKDGTIAMVGSLERDTTAAVVREWHDVVAITVGDGHVVGLLIDDTVVATGSDAFGQCDVSSW